MPQKDIFKNPTAIGTKLGNTDELEEIHRSIYFVMVNGIRSIRTKTD